jgi:hypothetical protein
MNEASFSQPERRSYLIPVLIALFVVCGVIAYVLEKIPRRTADLAITHIAVLPTHTVLKSDSKVVGHKDEADDDLYVVANVRVDDRLHVPLLIKDITATLIAPDDTVRTTSAVDKSDLANLYAAFPALKPMASEPLLRESVIRTGDHAEGMVLLHFPIPEADWKQRKIATLTLDFYHQNSLTVEIPKP